MNVLKAVALAGIVSMIHLVPTATLRAEAVDYEFKVKGVVKVLPKTEKEPREILVKHEAIPEYRDSDGAVVGMAAMTMPFYLAPSVKLDGIAVGDPVEMNVEVRTKPAFKERVIALEKIASGN